VDPRAFIGAVAGWPSRRAAYRAGAAGGQGREARRPYQEPTKFELVMNRRTEHPLGLTLPPSLLGRADQVIE
jgi:putative tryptophan/tyrosine transport system substrate-binding protein